MEPHMPNKFLGQTGKRRQSFVSPKNGVFGQNFDFWPEFPSVSLNFLCYTFRDLMRAFLFHFFTMFFAIGFQKGARVY